MSRSLFVSWLLPLNFSVGIMEPEKTSDDWTVDQRKNSAINNANNKVSINSRLSPNFGRDALRFFL